MKKVFRIALLVASVSLFANVNAVAQCAGCPPPPPPSTGQGGPGNGGVEPCGGCAPVDGGAAILVIMGLAYMARKTYQYKVK